MAKRFCAGCGEPLAPGFRICPKCGKVSEAEKPRPDFRAAPPSARYAPGAGGGRRPAPMQGRNTAPVRRTDSYAPGDRLTYEPQRRQNDIYGERQRRADSYSQGGGYGYEQPRRENDIYGERQRRADSYSQGGGYGYEQPRRTAPPRQAPARPAAPVKTAKKKKNGLSRFLDTSSKVVRVVVNTVKIAILLTVIYACLFLIEVYRVKLTPYPYSSSMRMSRNNFGQAISTYFSDGHWMVNPFTLKCSYKGKTNHNEEMEIVFNARIKVELAEITIDGEPLESRQFEQKVMGMFI